MEHRYVVVTNSGLHFSVPRGEAQTWVMLSETAGNCSVFDMRGLPIPLCMFNL